MKPWAVMLALAAGACAYVEATTVPYVGVEKFAPVDPAPTTAEIEKRFREEAAKWGANAVYVVRDSLPPGKERQLVGIAIRYR